MLLLPPIAWSHPADAKTGLTSVRLPCPAGDVIRLVAAADGTVGTLLKTNPSVLLFACWHYQKQTNTSVTCWRSLERWADKHLVHRLCESAVGTDGPGLAAAVVVEPGKIQRAVARILISFDPAAFRKSIVRFVSAVTGSKRSAVRHGFPDWFALESGSGSRRRKGKKKRVTGYVEKWQFLHNEQEFEDVRRLLQLKLASLASEASFESRLQDDKLAAMKQLAYGASHEINNPLANVATRAQGLLVSETHPDRRHKLATIYEQAMRAHEMISDMMLFANPPTLQGQVTDLRLLLPAIIRDVETSLAKQQAFHNKQIEYSFRLGPNVPSVLIDPTQISVLLHSLIKNSMEAIETQGRIEVCVKQMADRSIEISVVDDGVGVSPLAKQHLFDPFYSGREAGRGLGFGLSKAWRIAELHGGKLTHDEEYSNGTRFVLKLPLAENDSMSNNDPFLACSTKATADVSNAA